MPSLYQGLSLICAKFLGYKGERQTCLSHRHRHTHTHTHTQTQSYIHRKNRLENIHWNVKRGCICVVGL